MTTYRKREIRHSPALGQILRGQRQAKGISQAALGDHLGVGQGGVSRMESGDQVITFDQFCEAAGFLGCTITSLAHLYQYEVVA